MLPRHVETEAFENTFEMLIEKGEELIRAIRETGADAMLKGDHRTVDWASSRAKALNDLLKQLKDFRKTAEKTLRGRGTVPSVSPAKTRTTRQYQSGGLSEKDFYTPILVILLDAGGKVSTDVMRDRLHQQLRDQLTPEDMLGMPSNPNLIRWWYKAQRASNRLNELGYITKPKNSRHTWELTPKGREEAQSIKDALLRKAMED